MISSKFYIGVVEDRNDPLKMGRCRVRIFGLHSDSRLLLPTQDLPWSVPLLPVTSGSISGIGVSPTGITQGAWCVLIMLDGDECQQPMILGTILSKSMDVNGTQKIPEGNTNLNDGVLRNQDGIEVKDSDGNPIRFGVPKKEGWFLGKTSEQYESGGRGPGTINDYRGAASGDFGGASYGSFQFASYLPNKMGNGKSRPTSSNSPVLQYVNRSRFRNKFEGMGPATPEFDSVWKSIASSDKDAFEEEQRDYIKRKYYDVAMSNIMRYGIDLTKYGPGVQDLVWSSAVQLGPSNSAIYKFPLQGKPELDDKTIIELVMEYKIANVKNLFRSSSPAIQQSIVKRWNKEKADLLALVG